MQQNELRYRMYGGCVFLCVDLGGGSSCAVSADYLRSYFYKGGFFNAVYLCYNM